jgi:hypothetical protein
MRYCKALIYSFIASIELFSGFQNCEKSDTSEVYEYKPNGKGSWKSGVALPSELRESSIKDHCVVRYNFKIVVDFTIVDISKGSDSVSQGTPYVEDG